MVTFAVPLFLAHLLQAVYNVVDMVVVGQVVGEAGLSGISVGGDVLSLLTFLSMGFSQAGQIIIAQYIGAGLKERLSRFIGTMSVFLALCAVVMSLGCILLREQILGLLNTPLAAWDQAMEYSVVCMLGLVFIYGYNTVSAILRGMGDSKRPLMFIAIAAVLNLILDLIFVVGFGWEAVGAALATVIAQGVSFLTALVYLYKNRDRLGVVFTRHNFRIDFFELKALVKLGVPMAIRLASVTFSKLFVGSWINSYGVTISAVTGIGLKIAQVGNLLGASIAAASNSMVGQNVGAEKYGRVTKIMGVSLGVNGICFAVMIALIVLFPRVAFGFFTNDPGVLNVCMEYVSILVVTFVCDAFRNSMYGFINGCGNYVLNFCSAIIDGVVMRIGLSLLLGLSVGLGYYGFWLGSAVANCTPFVIGGIYYLSGRWKKKSALLAAK